MTADAHSITTHLLDNDRLGLCIRLRIIHKIRSVHRPKTTLSQLFSKPEIFLQMSTAKFHINARKVELL